MLMWDNVNDERAFDRFIEAQNIPVIRVPWAESVSADTGETKCPGWIPVAESVDLDARCSTLAARLAQEQQTVQRLVRLNDDLQHCAERWQMRAAANAFWPFVCGAMTPGIVWIFWQVAR